MADEIVKIIRIESDGAEQTVASLVNEIKSLTEAMNGVQKGTEEYTNILKDLIDNQDKLSKAMKTSKQEATAAEGSYNALVKQMAALKKQWRETTDEASRKELGNQIKDINGKLKNMDASIGNFQRNVGNYADGVKGAFGQMGGAAKGMVGPLNSVKQGFNALSAHPLVAVLTALAALLINGIAKGFKSSEENTNKLRTAFAGFQAIGDAVLKLFQGLAGWIAKVAEAAVNFADKLGLLGPKFKQRQEMMKKQIELEKQERDLIVKTAQIETDAAELRAKASDEENYTIAQRIQFLQEAQAKEQEQLELEKAILEQKVAQLEAQLALTDSTGEELTKLNELKAQVIQVNAKIAQSQRSTNKEIAGLRRRGLSEAQQANQARLNLEKDLLQQELELAEEGSEEQLRLAKELRDKELEIQLEGLKQKIKNRSDYEKAVKLATEAYNKDIAALEDTYARKQAEKYINEYTYELTRGLREGSAEWYQALSKAEMKLWQQQSEMPKRKDETETEYKQRLDSYLKQANIYVDQMNQAYEKHVQTVNQIVLNSTRPLSNYYATQRDQLIKFWQDMRQLSTEDDAEFASRRNEVWKQVIDAQMNYQDAIKNEYKRFLDYQAALTYDGTSDINKDLKSNLKYYQDIWEDTLNDIQDYVSLNWTEIIPKLGMSVDEFDEAFGSPYGLQEIMDRMVNLGLVPDELIDQYIESLRNMADAEKEILDYRYDNWDNLAKGIADTMGGISDIYAIKLENEKKTLEKEGKYTEQERKNLEQRYKTVQTMQIAEATINTISGAVAAFMKCQELGQPWGAVLGAVQAAAVTAAGVAQIMKIKQTNPYSDTSSSLSSGGGMMSATVQPTVSDFQPNYGTNLTGRSDTDYLNEVFGKTRLVVSVSEINEVQNRVRVVESESQF